MAPFPPSATCVLPMSAREYMSIQDQPAFRSLLAQAHPPCHWACCMRLLPAQGLLQVPLLWCMLY